MSYNLLSFSFTRNFYLSLFRSLRLYYSFSIVSKTDDGVAIKDSDASDVFLYPNIIIALKTSTPTARLLHKIRSTYVPNRGLPNFFARPIFTAVFVTSAIIMATVAVREARD